ncbi:MAG TPA: heavy metal sensor histidine kinase, partial [Gemmataceae bacterium]|nr:heavy metal sensor histidine kinase [Gemmataceae bacterium]
GLFLQPLGMRFCHVGIFSIQGKPMSGEKSSDWNEGASPKPMRSGSPAPALGPPFPTPRPRSLAVRLTMWYAGSAFLLILLVTVFLYWALISNLDREDDEFLANKIQILRTVLRDKPEDMAALKQEVEWEGGSPPPVQVYVRILDRNEKTILETPGMKAELPVDVFPAPHNMEGKTETGHEYDSPSGKSFRLLAAPVPLGNAPDSIRLVQVALDRTSEENLMARYRLNLVLILGLALGACAFVGYRIARRGLQPLREITATARRIRSSTLNERIDRAGLPAELSILAETFNDMLDRLENSFNRLARFSADIAHELRTPVNNLRGETEVALSKPRTPEEYSEVLVSCLEECGKLSRTIDSLLFLARAESPQMQITREPIDLERELIAMQDFYEVAATDAGVTLQVIINSPIVISLNRTLFQRAIGNLVANALAHTLAGGIVTLSARKEGAAVYVEVADTGCGIPKDHLPHVFDRFYRVDQARSSTSGRVGLGLAIVQSIANLHQGSVSIASDEDKGTRVTLQFPGTL